MSPWTRAAAGAVGGGRERIAGGAVLLLGDVGGRLPEATPLTFSSGEYPACAEALLSVFGGGGGAAARSGGAGGGAAGPRRGCRGGGGLRRGPRGSAWRDAWFRGDAWVFARGGRRGR